MMKPLRQTRFYLLLVTVLVCSHCTPLQPEPHNIEPAQEINQWLTQTDLSHAQWLLDQQQLLEKQAHFSEITPSQLQKNQQPLIKQQTQLATQLLLHCQQLTVEASAMLLNQCHMMLAKLPLDELQVAQLQALKRPKLVSPTPIPRSTPTPTLNKLEPLSTPIIAATPAPIEKIVSSNELLQLCQQNAQKGKWQQVHQQIAELRRQNNLSADALKKINLIERNLTSVLEQMDNRAELLYQNKKVVDAQRIWVEILQIAPEKQDIRNKHQRAQTVLDNIKALRQQPNNAL